VLRCSPLNRALCFSSQVEVMDFESSLLDIHHLYGNQLSDELIEFFTAYAGSELSELEIELTVNYYGNITQQESLEKICSSREVIEIHQYLGFLEDYVVHFEISKDFVEAQHLYPVALSYDSLYLISLSGVHSGKVYHADNGDFGIGLVCNSLKDFKKLVGLS
ncbi:hypothetical protein, partial [Vibrio alginolyticus]